ncbi:MAG: efflux RND transporter periplasmic adaptor subunit, partial [Nevskiales bacterium]
MKKSLILIPAILVLALAGYLLADWLGGEQSGNQPGISGAESYESGPFKVSISLSPQKPVVGNNQMLLRLSDADGNPVEDADIQAYGEMPAMGTMAAMRAPVSFKETGDGQYEGDFKLEMRGEWPLSLIIKADIGETRLGFDMATGRAGLQLSSGGKAAQPGQPQSDQVMADHNHDHDVSHYTCPMHPSVEEAGPGQCPICGMDLVPVAKEEVESGTITIDARRRQLIGVKTAQVTHKDLTKVIRAVGKVDYDERSISNVTLKFDAWIGELKADYVGAQVKRGQVLFTVYSPELLAAQQEYLETLQRLSRRGPDDSLIQAARKRLMLWDISSAQVRQLEKRGKPLEYLPIYAPNAGTVVEKHVVAGSHMKTGSTLLRIADLSRVWVDAEVYEGDLPLPASFPGRARHACAWTGALQGARH